MIKIENIDVWGWEHAIRGMRNPMNSWCKSDSYFTDHGTSVGENDMDLMHRLYKAGVEHRTFARMIMVSMDITAPLYWWKEADRYRFKEQISCSTMHKIADNEFTLEDFSCEHLNDILLDTFIPIANNDHMTVSPKEVLERFIIPSLNHARTEFLESKDKRYWWQMIQLLPSSYNQRRTVMMSYETAMKMIRERENHKLDEWRDMVKVLMNLPYMREIINE